MKSKELKIYNIPINFKPLIIIDAKPSFLLLAISIIGFVLFGYYKTRAYGATIAIVGLTFLMFMPKHTMLEFYKDYMIMHNKADKTDCVLIYYEDIVTWYYQRGTNKDYLYIELVNNTSERIEAFSKTEFEMAMNRFVKDKHKKRNK